MTKAVLLMFLALCDARASAMEVSPATVATCTTDNKDNSAKVTAPGDNKDNIAKVTAPGALTVTCPEKSSLYPSDKAKVFKTVACTEPDVELKSLVPGATMNETTAGPPGRGVSAATGNTSQKYTFTVEQMPLAAVSVFYLCKQAESAPLGTKQANRDLVPSPEVVRCTIEIQIAAGDPLGPNTCAVEGGRINLDLRAVGETARFSCSEGKKLLPPSATKAYDSTCSQEVDLPRGLAQRQIVTEYYLDLKELPKRAQQLCYLCETAKKTTSQSGGCQVHVRSAGAEPGGVVGARARGTTALSLALLAATGLYTS